jgi:hypothetical protein
VLVDATVVGSEVDVRVAVAMLVGIEVEATVVGSVVDVRVAVAVLVGVHVETGVEATVGVSVGGELCCAAAGSVGTAINAKGMATSNQRNIFGPRHNYRQRPRNIEFLGGSVASIYSRKAERQKRAGPIAPAPLQSEASLGRLVSGAIVQPRAR